MCRSNPFSSSRLKDDHRVRYILDFTYPNELVNKESQEMEPISLKVMQFWSHKYCVQLDFRKQYHQIVNQHHLCLCVFHRDDVNQDLEIYIHHAVAMGHRSSAKIAGTCTVESPKRFDTICDDFKNGKAIQEYLYPPLKRALPPSKWLDSNSAKEDMSLEESVKLSMYADNNFILGEHQD